MPAGAHDGRRQDTRALRCSPATARRGHGLGAKLCTLWMTYLLLLHPTAALYHTASETLHWFAHTARKLPDRMRYTTLTEDPTRAGVPLATLGRRPGAASAPGAAPPPRVIFVFGEHCREIITTEVGLWLARLLVDDDSGVRLWPELHWALERAGEAPAGAGGIGAAGAWPATIDAWASEVLEQLSIQIVPIESVEGRRLVEAGQLCMRKTPVTNVDLNRNWPFAWQRVADPADEQYGGPRPLSEPQSRLVKRLIDESPVAAYLNVHSGEWALYTPWDSKPAYGSGLPPDLPGLVAKLGDVCRCMAGPAGAVSGYLAFGSSMDYAYVNSKTPYPLTVEVYGSNQQGKLKNGAKNKPLGSFPIVYVKPEAIANSSSGNSSSSGSSNTSPKVGAASAKPAQGVVGAGRRLQAVERAAGDPAVGAAGLRLAVTVAMQRRRQRQLQQQQPQPQEQRHRSWDQQQQQQQQQQPQQQQPQQHHRQQQQQEQWKVSRRLLGRRPHNQTDEIMAAYLRAPQELRQCFEIFNPVDEVTYREVVGDWLAAFLIVLRHVAKHVAPGSARQLG